MAVKLAFINSKGGCGKTTSIFHISGILSKSNKKVLVIDLDKQKNTTSTLMMYVNKNDYPRKTVFDFLQGKAAPEAATGKALFQHRGNATPKYYGVDCMVSDVRLENESLLKKADGNAVSSSLEEFISQRQYDWVLVDMPPSNLTLNHICFSYIVNFAVIPFSSDMFSLDGYDSIAETIRNARDINANLNNLGVYLSRYMGHCALDKYIKNELSERLYNRALNKNDFIDVQIPIAADIREAVFYGRPINYYKEFSNSSKAYKNLVAEIIKRIQSHSNKGHGSTQ